MPQRDDNEKWYIGLRPSVDDYMERRARQVSDSAATAILGQNLPDVPKVPAYKGMAGLLSRGMGIFGMSDESRINLFGYEPDPWTCLWTATNQYGDKGARASGNVSLKENPGKYGFESIPVRDARRGDLLQFTPDKIPEHSAIFTGEDEEHVPLVSYSRGGTGTTTITPDGEKPTMAHNVNIQEVINKEGEPSAYKYIGSHNKRREWMREYYDKYGNPQKVNPNLPMFDFRDTEYKFPIERAEGGSISIKKAWDDLSMREKAEMIRVAVANGITNLSDIRQKYNEFAMGGDTDEELKPISLSEAKRMGAMVGASLFKQPKAYIGGTTSEARDKYWQQDNEMRILTDSVANRYNISPDLLRSRMDNEGYTDSRINEINMDVKTGSNRALTGERLFHSQTLPVDAINEFGFDDVATYINDGTVNLINENWGDGQFENEKGRWTHAASGYNYSDNIGIMAATLKGLRDLARKDFPNASEADLDRYAQAYYNRGIKGGREWVKRGAKGYRVSKHALGGPIVNAANTFGGGGYVYDVLPQLMKDAGLNVRVTSGYRKPGVAGKAGSKSWHGRHGAVDIVPQGKTTFEDIENAIYNNPVISNYMLSNGFGLIDESGRSAESKATMKKTGATGAHFHIGKDSTYAKRYADRMAELARLNQTPVAFRDNTLFVNPYIFEQQNTTMLPQVVPAENQYVMMQQETPEQQRARKVKEQFDNINRFNAIMELIGNDLRIPTFTSTNPLLDMVGEYANGGGIHIKKSHRGRLTDLKKRTGKTEAELYNDGNPAHKKMVVFARNARKFKHGYGGPLVEWANRFDGVSNPTGYMNLGLNATNTWQPYTLGQIVSSGAQITQQRKGIKKAAEKMLADNMTESNDATAVAGGRPQNEHLKEKGLNDMKAHAAWEKEHPALAAWSYLPSIAVFGTAAAPLIGGLAETTGGAALTTGLNWLSNAAKSSPIVNNSLSKALGTSTLLPWADAALTSSFGAHGVQKVVNGEGVTPETALELMPLGQIVTNGAKTIPELTKTAADKLGFFVEKPGSFTRGIGGEAGLQDLIESGLVRGNPVGTEMSAHGFAKAYRKNRDNFRDIMDATGREGIAQRYYNRTLNEGDFKAIKDAAKPYVEKWSIADKPKSGRFQIALGRANPDPLSEYSDWEAYQSKLASDRLSLKNATSLDESGQPLAYFYDDGRNPLTAGHDYAASQYGVRINNASDYSPRIFPGHLHYSMPNAVSISDPNVEVFKRGLFGVTRRVNKDKLLEQMVQANTPAAEWAMLLFQKR